MANINTISFWNDERKLNDYKEYSILIGDAATNTTYCSAFMDMYDTSARTEKFGGKVGASIAQFVAEGDDVPMSEQHKAHDTMLVAEKTVLSIDITYEMRQDMKDSESRADEVMYSQVDDVMVALKNKIEEEGHKYFNQGFSLVGPDGQPIFSANHTFGPGLSGSGQTFSNLLTAAAPSIAKFDEVMRIASAFEVLGKKKPIKIKYIYAKENGTAAQEIKKILYNNGQYAPTVITGTNGINIYAGGAYGLQLIETPFIDDDKAYFFQADYSRLGMKNPLIMGYIARPSIEGEFTALRNMTYFTNYMADFKTGFKTVPVGLYGVNGTW